LWWFTCGGLLVVYLGPPAGHFPGVVYLWSTCGGLLVVYFGLLGLLGPAWGVTFRVWFTCGLLGLLVVLRVVYLWFTCGGLLVVYLVYLWFTWFTCGLLVVVGRARFPPLALI